MITTIAVAVVSGAVGGVLGLLALCWLYDWATEPEHTPRELGAYEPYGER